MLKEWFWWQIEASLEHLEEESTIPLSNLTVYFWMALVVKGCAGSQEKRDCFAPGGEEICPSELNSYPHVFTTAM